MIMTLLAKLREMLANAHRTGELTEFLQVLCYTLMGYMLLIMTIDLIVNR